MDLSSHSLVASAKYVPIALGVVFTTFAADVTGAPWVVVGANFSFYVLGFLMFLQAKRSLRTGGSNERSGPRKMTPSNQLLYRIGFGLMLLGALFTFVLYNVTFAGVPAPPAA